MTGPVRPPLSVSDGTTTVRPTNSIVFDAADGFTVTDNGASARIDFSGGGSATLTDTHIGFGSASNLLTGSANFTFTEESGGTGPTMLLTGDKPQITIQDDTDATDYKTKLIQSGASLYHYSADSTGTNNEMARYAQNYIAFQRAMTPNVGIGTVPSSGVALHIKDDESDNDNVVLRIQDSSVDTVGDQVAIEGYWNTAQAGVIFFELRDTTTAASAIVMKASNDAGSLTEFVRMDGDSKAITFNEQSEDMDFRVETDGNDSTLRIVGSTDNVGMGGIPGSDVERLHVYGAGTDTLVKLESTDSGADNAPDLELFRNSPSPASADYTGAIRFSGYEDTGATSVVDYARIDTRMFGLDGTENGVLVLYTRQNNALRPQISMKSTGVIINENQESFCDFAVETTGSTTTLFVDSGNDNVGIGTVADSDARLHVKDDGTEAATVRIESTDTDADSGPVIEFFRNSASPTAGDDLGYVNFTGENASGSKVSYAAIRVDIDDTTASGEDASLNFLVTRGGSSRKLLRARYSEVVVNEDSDDVDFRVESNSNSHMLQVDSGNNLVSVGAQATTGLSTFQVKDNTIAHYCNVNTIRSDAVSTMVMVNEDNQGQMWVHDSVNAHTLQLVEGGVKGMHFQFMSTDGNITVDPQGTDTLNGGTASLTRSTNYEIYDVFCYDTGKWALSNPA